MKNKKFVYELISELSEYLKGNLKFTKDEKAIIEDFFDNNKLTTASKNYIIKNERELVEEIARENFKNDIMYFVKDSKKFYWKNNKKEIDEDSYSVLKVQDGRVEEIGINKNEMPAGIGVNQIFNLKNGEYIVDDFATMKFQERLTNMAEEVLNVQNANLLEHRKEGHLYLITEELGSNRSLWDLTDKPKTEFEEVNIPNELLKQATEGIILKYIGRKV